VLLFIDNIFRFVQAARKFPPFSAACLRPSATSPTQYEIGELQERITSTKSGSITSVQAIYVPADDYTDPAPAARWHLDATTNLSRQSSSGASIPPSTRWPARRAFLTAHCRRGALRRGAGVKSILQRYKDLQDIIAILVSKNFPTRKRTVARPAQDRKSSFAAHVRAPRSSPASKENT